MSTAESEDSTSRRPACDACRNRKIKCDREVPCGSCRQWKVPCKTTVRPKERKQRILISHKYENEFADLNRKLEQLSVTLQSFVDQKKPEDARSAQALHTQVADVLATVKQEEDVEDEYFEGDSSFQTQSNEIVQLLGATIEGIPGQGRLLSLSDTFKPSPSEASSGAKSTTPSQVVATTLPQLTKLPLPPAAEVLMVLKIAKAHSVRLFTDFPFLEVDAVTTLCQRLYFPTEDYTLSTFLTVNCCLRYLFSDLPLELAEQYGLDKTKLVEYAKLCVFNVLSAVKLWGIGIENTYDNLIGLTMSTFILLEGCHMSLAWNVCGLASRLAQDAGLHRASTYLDPKFTPHDAFNRKWLFWSLYSLDHCLSLSFGRPPSVPDYDISVEKPRFEDHENLHIRQLFMWISLGTIEGKIYTDLYSARAQQMSAEVRIATAQVLARELLNLEKVYAPFYCSLGSDDYAKGASTAAQVVLVSCLTMVYKVMPPSNKTASGPMQFSDECIAAAKRAITILCDCWQGANFRDQEQWKVFVHWTLIGCPFVPFIVLFGHVMAVHSVEDFELLTKAIQTIQQAAQLSTGLNKIHEACQNFYQIASHRYQPQTQHPSAVANPIPSSIALSVVQQSTIGVQGDSLPSNQPDFNFADLSMPDWNQVFDGWEMGLGADNAKEMTNWFEHYAQQQDSISFG